MVNRDKIQDALSKDDDRYFDARSKAQIVTSVDRLRVVLRPLEDASKARRLSDVFPWLASTIGFLAPVVRQFNLDYESIRSMGTVTFGHWILPAVSLSFAVFSLGMMVMYFSQVWRDRSLFKHSAETVIGELTNLREPPKPSALRNILNSLLSLIQRRSRGQSDPPKLDLS